MFYRPGRDPHGLPHDPFKACVAPRPIAWVTSHAGPGGAVNLAPFSFFNAVSENPPQIMISCNGPKPQIGGPKDTRRNIEATGEFVVHMVRLTDLEPMSASSAGYPADVGEAEALGLALAPSREVAVPRLAAAPVALECRLSRVVPLMDPSEAMLIGAVVGIYIDDAALTEGLLDLARLQPLARLGYQDYAAVERVFSRRRPVARP